MARLHVEKWQQEFILCVARFIALMAGRRAGKTDAIKKRMMLKGSRHPKFRFMYTTPLAVQGTEVYDQICTDKDFRPFIKKFRERPYPIVRIKNGSRIWFRSFQRPEGLRSTGEDEIYIDESQDPKITKADINSIIKPMLSDRIGPDGQRGKLILAGQFRGEDFRFTDYWTPGQEFITNGQGIQVPNLQCRRPTYWSWAIPSWEGYVFKIPGGKEELELQKQSCTPEEWDREWACKPRATQNAVFPSFEVEAICLASLPPEEEPKRSGGYCALVDVGGITDPTKLLIGHKSGDLVFEKAWPLGTHDQIVAREAVQIASKFRASVVVDTTGGGVGGHYAVDSRIKFYRADCVSFRLPMHEFVFTRQNKERVITNLRTAIQDRTIHIASGLTGLPSELKAYEYKFLRLTNSYQYGAPSGQHDDYVACAAMFVEASNRGWIGTGDRSGLGRMFN